MDPVSIASVVVSATATCLKTTKCFYDLSQKYKDTPVVVVSLCSESTVISASLAQLQSLLLNRADLASAWRSRSDLASALDTSLTGCMVLYSCLDQEIQAITSGAADPGKLQWKARIRTMWNEDKLKDLLSALRGQQTAITLLIQLLQMDTLEDIRQMLARNQETIEGSVHRTHSLRRNHPNVYVPNSIYEGPDCENSVANGDGISVIAPSKLEFAFDDLVINSQAYRRVLAQARSQAYNAPVENSGDLIDFSDNGAVIRSASCEDPASQTLRELADLNIQPSLSQLPKQESTPIPASTRISDNNPEELGDVDLGSPVSSQRTPSGPNASKDKSSQEIHHPSELGCVVVGCATRPDDYASHIGYQAGDMCLLHHALLVNAMCSGCDMPQVKTRKAQSGGDSTQVWHRECQKINECYRINSRDLTCLTVRATRDGWVSVEESPERKVTAKELFDALMHASKVIKEVWVAIAHFEEVVCSVSNSISLNRARKAMKAVAQQSQYSWLLVSGVIEAIRSIFLDDEIQKQLSIPNKGYPNIDARKRGEVRDYLVDWLSHLLGPEAVECDFFALDIRVLVHIGFRICANLDKSLKSAALKRYLKALEREESVGWLPIDYDESEMHLPTAPIGHTGVLCLCGADAKNGEYERDDFPNSNAWHYASCCGKCYSVWNWMSDSKGVGPFRVMTKLTCRCSQEDIRWPNFCCQMKLQLLPVILCLRISE
ncbi:Fc.00g034750.m01.CDS01 [Cosmosporella sp. VM-42]